MLLRSIFVMFPVLALSCAEPFRCDQSLTCRLSSDASATAASDSELAKPGPMEEAGAGSEETDEEDPTSGEAGASETSNEPTGPVQSVGPTPSSTGPVAPEMPEGPTDVVVPPASSGDPGSEPPPEPQPSGEPDAASDEPPAPLLDAGSATQPQADATEPDPVTEPEPTPEPDAGGVEDPEPEIVDHCEVDNGGCDVFAECTSTPTDAECGACREGYSGDGTTGCAPTLLSLATSVGSVEPELEPGLDLYELVVPVFLGTVTLTPSVPAGAMVSIDGSVVAAGESWTSPTLELGVTELSVVVEQEGQPDSMYQLRMTRGADVTKYLKASNTDAGDGFGVSVALSADGSTLAVGAPYEASSAPGVGADEANNDAAIAGAVYVFTRGSTGWAQQAYIKASDAYAQDHFGFVVALSGDGNTLAVGALGEDSSATGVSGAQNASDALQSGAVYVFARSGAAWTQQSYIKASNTGAGDSFGQHIALSSDGKTLAVGAPYEDSNATGSSGAGQDDDSADGAGAVYVFARGETTWSQTAYLKASNTGTADNFGWSVSLSTDGSTLAVGALREDSNAKGVSGTGQNNNDAEDAGAVYVFARANESWTQQAYLKASNAEAGDLFGAAVGLSGDGSTLAVGAELEASDSNNASGGDQNDNAAPGAGAAYVFVRTGAVWTQEAYIKAPNSGAGDKFSRVSLSQDGTALAVGAYAEDANAFGVSLVEENDGYVDSGAVYTFARSAGLWSRQAYIKAPNTDAGDMFGLNIGLSGDGTTLAVGAYWEDSSASGTSGALQSDDSADAAGAVYVYR